MGLRKIDSSFVYFLRPVGLSGPVKIGCAIAPEQRRQRLSASSPFPLEFMACFPGNIVLEQRLHARFAHLHSHGEWFRADPLLDEVAASIGAGTFDFDSLPPPRLLYENGNRRAAEARRAAQDRPRQAA